MTKLKYSYDTNGNIILPDAPPFDGNAVLIKTNTGWVEAWWCKSTISETLEGPEYDGFYWVCYDDMFTCELDEALEWIPLPKSEEE